MSNNDKAPQPEQEQAPATEPALTKKSKAEQPKAETKADKTVKKGGLLTPLLLLIVLAAIAALGWYGYQYWLGMQNQQRTTQAEIAAYEDRLNALERQLTELTDVQKRQGSMLTRTPDQIEQVQQQVQQKLSEFNQQLKDQTRLVGSLQSEIAAFDLSQTAAWRIVEARNLAAMAGRKVWLEGNIGDAIELLGLADSHLQALNNPAHLPVRQSIQDDLELLRSIADVDTDAVVMRLRSAADAATKIGWQQSPTLDDAETQARADNPTWRQNLAQSWQAFINQFIRVQRHDQPIDPLLQQDFIRVLAQRVQLSLQLAQHAAVNRDQARFESALQQTQALLTEYAPNNDATAQQLLATLNELANVTLTQALPEQLESIERLQRLASSVTEEDNA